MGQEPHSLQLPEPPWQQQIQSAGIQDTMVCIPSTSSRQHRITLVFLVLYLLGLIHHSTESQGMSHLSVEQVDSKLRLWLSKALGQTPEDAPCADRDMLPTVLLCRTFTLHLPLLKQLKSSALSTAAM